MGSGLRNCSCLDERIFGTCRWKSASGHVGERRREIVRKITPRQVLRVGRSETGRGMGNVKAHPPWSGDAQIASFKSIWFRDANR